MEYSSESVEGRLLDEDPVALARVSRWIAVTLTAPRFWALRSEWLDIHQDALARLIESLREGRYDPGRDFRTYAQGIARHAALQALDRRRRAGEAGPDPADRAAPDPEQRASRRQLARRVLELASEECRHLIRAYFYEDRTYAEIAASLGVPVGTVKSRLFRCLEAAHASLRGIAPRRNQRRAARNKSMAEGPE